MRKLFDDLGTGLVSFVEDGQFLMLFMVALLLLWLIGEKEKKEFRKYALVMLILLLFPLSAKLLAVYQTNFYGYENMWELLPVTALLAYGLVTASFQMVSAMTREYGRWKSAVSKAKEIACQVLAVAVLTAVLFLCGTLTVGKEMGARAEGVDKLPADVEEVLDLLEIPADSQVMLLAPDAVMSWARIYSGDILLPYGRNLYEPALSAYTYDTYAGDMQQLHDWVNGSLPTPEKLSDAAMQEEIFISACASLGYDYLVFSRERAEDDALKPVLANQKEYELYAQTEGYHIYRLP